MISATRINFGSTKGVGSRCNVLRSGTHFGGYRGRRVQFSYFALPYPFWAVPMTSGSVFIFCAPGPVLGGAEGAGSSFHALRSRTYFGRYRGCWFSFHVLRSRAYFGRYRGLQVQFSCFALPDSFSAVPRASGSIFMFCAPEPVLGDTVGVGSPFHVLCSQFSVEPRALGPAFMFCAPGLIFGGIEGVVSRFHDFRHHTQFRRYRGCRDPLYCFTLPDSF
jgi:hypothetical protein